MQKSIKLSVIIYSLLICFFGSCKTQTSFDKIAFGKGGGFTGKYNDYLLDKDGTLFKKDPAKNSWVKLKKIAGKELKELSQTVADEKIISLNFNHPYNMSSYIEIRKDTIINRIIWGDAKNPPPQGVAVIFDQLMTQTALDKK